MIETSAPVTNLFQRAEDGVARRNWKLAIDSLQRIIEDGEGSLVPGSAGLIEGGAHFESARYHAARRLARFPPEGLHAYHFLFEGTAKGLLDGARESHDPAGLWMIMERYPLTASAPAAADLLASWALDAGRPAEVIGVLQRFRDLAGDPNALDDRMVAKLVLAHALLGRLADAGAIVDDYRESHDVSDGFSAWLGKLAEQQETPDGVTGSRWTEPLRWPIAGGTPSRRGIMPAIDPTITDVLPWRFDVSEDAASAWEQTLVDDPLGRLELPASRLVVDGDRVFVRLEGGCASLDVEDLRPLWQIPEAADRSGDSPAMPMRFADTATADAGADWDDTVAGSISVAQGLVMVVEKERTDRPSAFGRVIRRTPNRDGGARLRPNRLVARDVTTGQVAWQLGGTDDFADLLARAIFRSVPIDVAGKLWVPYINRKDLYTAVVDPEDGSLLHNILLCSVEQPWLHPDRALYPAFADGLVYIPTEHGVLFAIDADEFILRWAVRYVSDERVPPGDGSQDAGWLASPPVVAGGWVLLAPADYDGLVALDRTSGAFGWSTPQGRASYIVAANDERVWLGGRSIVSLATSDGRKAWETEIPGDPSGRAVLSGDVIYAPTYTGMVLVDAKVGGIMETRPLPDTGRPLGNLVCLHSAMFSRDAGGVRKFPDVAKLYAASSARHQADPSDVDATVRLAWLELLKGHPRQALKALDDITTDRFEEAPRLGRDVGHARVEALLTLAVLSTDTAEALDLLDRAGRAAPTAEDRLRCALGRADRQSAAGQRAAAYRTLLELGMSRDADRFLRLNRHVKAAARLDITRRLEALKPLLSEEQALDLEDFAIQRVGNASAQLSDESGRPEGLRLLRAVANLPSVGRASQRALLELGMHALQGLRYEQSEQLFTKCIQEDADPEATASATMHLRDIDKIVGAWSKRLHSIVAEGGPKPYSTTVGPPVPSESSDVLHLADHPSWWLRKPSNPQRTPAGVKLQQVATFALPDEITQAVNALDRSERVPRLVRFDGETRDVLAERVITYVPGDWILCHDALKGTLLWHTQLRLPESFSNDRFSSIREQKSWPRRGVVDGQTAVLSGRTGLYGIGLATGRRLWVRPFSTIDAVSDRPIHDMALAVRDGLVAATPRTGRLMLLRSEDGRTVWERTIRGERIARMWMDAGSVITADDRLQRVHVFDRANGSLLHRARFQQPISDGPPVHLAHFDGLIIGPDCSTEADAILAVPTDGGRSGWRIVLDKPLAQLFELSEGYVGAALLGGDTRVIETKTGEVVLNRRVPCGGTVRDGRWIDGTLVLLHGLGTGNDRRAGLAAVDVVTGDTLWHRDDLAAREWRVGALQVIRGLIPAVVTHREADDKPVRSIALTLIDLRTGEEVGPEAELHLKGTRLRFLGDYEIRSDTIVVQTSEGLLAFPISAPNAQAGDDS